MDRFTEISDRLSSAIVPCISRIVNSLHADGLIGFELKYELINGSETDARKANKLVTELERLLRNEEDPADFLKKICSVLKKQGETSLTEISDSLTSSVPEVTGVVKIKSSTVYILPEYIKEMYTRMNGKFAGVLSRAAQEAISEVDLEKIQLFLTAISPCMQDEAPSVQNMSDLVKFLRKYCFLSNFGMLQSLSEEFKLVKSQNLLKTFAKERDDFYKSILAEDFAKKAIEDHQTMDGQQEMTFKVSWPSNTTLYEFEAFLRDVFHRNKIFISLKTVHHSFLTFVCTIPNWLVDEMILFVKENRDLLKLKGVVEVSVDKTIIIIRVDFSAEHPSAAEAALEPRQKTLPITTETESISAGSGYYIDEELSRLCSCGECSLQKIITEGCPANTGTTSLHRFPLLDIKRLPKGKKQQYLYMIEKEGDLVNEAFASLYDDMAQSMKDIDVHQFKTFIKSKRWFDSSTVLNDKLNQCEDIESVFALLSNICSWFNYHPLKGLADQFGSEDVKEKYTDFINNTLLPFLKRSITEIPKDGLGGVIEGSGEFRLKMDTNAALENIRGEHLLFLKASVAEALKISPEHLHIVSIEQGCIEVTFMVPHSIYQELFPLSAKHFEALQAITVPIEGYEPLTAISVQWYDDKQQCIKKLFNTNGGQSTQASSIPYAKSHLKFSTEDLNKTKREKIRGEMKRERKRIERERERAINLV